MTSWVYDKSSFGHFLPKFYRVTASVITNDPELKLSFKCVFLTKRTDIMINLLFNVAKL